MIFVVRYLEQCLDGASDYSQRLIMGMSSGPSMSPPLVPNKVNDMKGNEVIPIGA